MDAQKSVLIMAGIPPYKKDPLSYRGRSLEHAHIKATREVITISCKSNLIQEGPVLFQSHLAWNPD